MGMEGLPLRSRPGLGGKVVAAWRQAAQPRFVGRVAGSLAAIGLGEALPAQALLRDMAFCCS